MRISVLLATYNGSKYIIEQLNSIKNQQRKPDEVVICDDKSKDNTIEIITKFIKDNNLINWRIIVNKANLGWKKNFIENIKETSGDIIFFCDQDDIWDLNKIKIMSEEMKKNDGILALSCYVRLIDENRNPIPLIKNMVANGEGTGKIYKNIFNYNFIFSGVAGCTMAIRRSLYNIIENIDMSFIAHDTLFWNLAIVFDGAYNIDLELLDYRVHGDNTTQANKNNIGKTDIKKRIEELKLIDLKVNKLKNIIEYNNIYKKEYKKKVIEDSLKLLNNRIKFLENKNIFSLISLVKNNKYKIVKNTVIIGDISYVLGINQLAGNLLYKIYSKDKKIN